MPREVLARPQRHTGLIVNGVYRNHDIRVREGYPARHADFACRSESHIVQEFFSIGGVQTMAISPSMQAHVERAPGKPLRPFAQH